MRGQETSRPDDPFSARTDEDDPRLCSDVLEEIIRTHGPRLESMIQRRFPQLASEAEDVLAEAFARAWKARKTYDSDRGPLFGWLSRIACNTAINLLRSRSSHPVGVSNADLDVAEAEATCSAESGLASGEGQPQDGEESAEQRDLREVLDQLSDVDRTIILRYALVDGQGPWAANLAAELNIDAGLIRVRRLRILDKIKAEMHRRGHPVAAEQSGQKGES
jgi:RNA polymerase sigma-70 factor (ECF subfamily)